MSFLDRSVPLKNAILAAIALAVFVGVLVEGIHKRSNTIDHYGEALPAKVVKVGEPKSVGGVLGFWKSTYTNAEVKVTPSVGQPWYYKVPISGRATVGQDEQAWFYDGNSNDAFISSSFDISAKESRANPWLSVEEIIGAAIGGAMVATFVVFIILRLLSPKKRSRSRGSRQDAVTT